MLPFGRGSCERQWRATLPVVYYIKRQLLRCLSNKALLLEVFLAHLLYSSDVFSKALQSCLPISPQPLRCLYFTSSPNSQYTSSHQGFTHSLGWWTDEFYRGWNTSNNEQSAQQTRSKSSSLLTEWLFISLYHQLNNKNCRPNMTSRVPSSVKPLLSFNFLINICLIRGPESFFFSSSFLKFFL